MKRIVLLCVLVVGTVALLWVGVSKARSVRESARKSPLEPKADKSLLSPSAPRAIPAPAPEVAPAPVPEPPAPPKVIDRSADDVTELADGQVIITARVTGISMQVDDWLSGAQNPRPALTISCRYLDHRLEGAAVFKDPGGDWYYALRKGDRIAFRGNLDFAGKNPDGTVTITLSECVYVGAR